MIGVIVGGMNDWIDGLDDHAAAVERLGRKELHVSNLASGDREVPDVLLVLVDVPGSVLKELALGRGDDAFVVNDDPVGLGTVDCELNGIHRLFSFVGVTGVDGTALLS
jgi:hypothetical protein